MPELIKYGAWAVLMLGVLFSEVRAQAVDAKVMPVGLSEPAFSIEVRQESKIWLEGSANVVDFACHASQISSQGTISGLDTSRVSPGAHGAVVLEVRIPVSNLDCGKPPINRDMRNTLNASKHPLITYRLDRNRLIRAIGEGMSSVFEIETFGELVISGTSRMERIVVRGEFLGPWQFRITGSHRIHMPDYNLVPPSPMFGLIKVSDELVVHFDVVLSLVN